MICSAAIVDGFMQSLWSSATIRTAISELSELSVRDRFIGMDQKLTRIKLGILEKHESDTKKGLYWSDCSSSGTALQYIAQGPNNRHTPGNSHRFIRSRYSWSAGNGHTDTNGNDPVYGLPAEQVNTRFRHCSRELTGSQSLRRGCKRPL